MRTFFALLTVVAVASAGGLPSSMLEHIKCAKLYESCWGEKNMKEWYEALYAAGDKCHGQKPTYSIDDLFGADINRVTRQSDSTNGDSAALDDYMQAFIEKFDEVKEMKVEALSNLTCVMKEMKMWREDGKVNIDYITGDMLKDAPFDKELSEMFRQGYKLCYKFSEALPVEDMKHPIKKMFGRQMMFHKCMLKTEEKLCAMNEITDYMQEKYGEFTSEKAAKMGLPNNKYEASLMAKLVMKKTMPETKKFVMSILYDGEPSY